jgi:hypothetical protein
MVMNAIVLVAGCLLAGCTVTREVYLQDLLVEGPVFQPAVHATTGLEEGQFIISPHVSILNDRAMRGRISGHSYVDLSGEFVVDTVWDRGSALFVESARNTQPFTGENLRWSMPREKIGVDIGYSPAPAVELTGGIAFASQENQRWWSWNLGIGFRTIKNNMAFRFDAGIQSQSLTYEASSVAVVTEEWLYVPVSAGRVAFFRDGGKGSHVGYHAAVTLNTLLENSPVNGLLQLAATRQILADFLPSTRTGFPASIFPEEDVSEKIDNKVAFVSLTPGIVIFAPAPHRFVAGVRFMWEIEAEAISPSMLVMPVVQYDFVF